MTLAVETLDADPTYPRIIRFLHWAMAIGFIAVWLTGVWTVNLEGRGSAAADDFQSAVRDLHKSFALTVVGLAVLRVFARALLHAPPLPAEISGPERTVAHLGHGALYLLIFLTSFTGLAIADLQDYGNAYFGMALPPVVPARPQVLGWSADPWAYVAHAILAYGLLALVVVHVAAVFLHRRQGVDLSSRITRTGSQGRRWVETAAAMLAVLVMVVAVAAVRGHATLGPAETPRDYGPDTRPF